MKSADFNQRITVQRPVRVTNTLGEREPDQWQTVSRPWAAIVTQRASEIVSALRTASERRVVFKVRTPFTHSADWRVLWNGDVYAIEGVTIAPRSGVAAIEARFVSGATGA